MKKSCVIYCRVSTPRQAQEGESLETQERICRGIAAERGYSVVPDGRVFREPFSGRRDHRPVFDEMLAFIRSQRGAVDYCLFRVIDRFTRGGSFAYETLKKELARHGVELIDSYGIIQPSQNTLAHLGIEYEWSRHAPSEIAEIMTASYGKTEVRNILTRLIGREIELTRQGYQIGNPNDGYVNQKVTVDGKKKVIQAPDPERAPFFREMYRLRAGNQLTDPEIVDRINTMGYRSRPMNRWDRATGLVVAQIGGKPLTVKHFQRLIRKPIYCGVICEKWTDGKPVRAAYDGLIGIETFNAANRGAVHIQELPSGGLEILYDYHPTRTVTKRLRNNPLFPYKNVVVCPSCRYPFVGSSPQGKSGKKFPTYHCSRSHKYLGIPKATFDETVATFVRGVDVDAEGIEELGRILHEKWGQRRTEMQSAAERVKTSVVKLEAKKRDAVNALIAARSDIVRHELERKVEELEAEAKQAAGVRENVSIAADDIEHFLDYARRVVEHLEELAVHSEELPVRQATLSLMFEELPTYDEIRNGTPKLSLIFAFSRGATGPPGALVDLRGIEPLISSMPWRRDNRYATGPYLFAIASYNNTH